jgi:hypothetical protein
MSDVLIGRVSDPTSEESSGFCDVSQSASSTCSNHVNQVTIQQRNELLVNCANTIISACKDYFILGNKEKGGAFLIFFIDIQTLIIKKSLKKCMPYCSSIFFLD